MHDYLIALFSILLLSFLNMSWNIIMPHEIVQLFRLETHERRTNSTCFININNITGWCSDKYKFAGKVFSSISR